MCESKLVPMISYIIEMHDVKMEVLDFVSNTQTLSQEEFGVDYLATDVIIQTNVRYQECNTRAYK